MLLFERANSLIKFQITTIKKMSIYKPVISVNDNDVEMASFDTGNRIVGDNLLIKKNERRKRIGNSKRTLLICSIMLCSIIGLGFLGLCSIDLKILQWQNKYDDHYNDDGNLKAVNQEAHAYFNCEDYKFGDRCQYECGYPLTNHWDKKKRRSVILDDPNNRMNNSEWFNQPYTALIVLNYTVNENLTILMQLCSCTIVDQETCVTAAHCVITFTGPFEIPEYNITTELNEYHSTYLSMFELWGGVFSSLKERTAHRFEMFNYIIHSNFSTDHFQNDIALIKFNNFDYHSIQFACLDETPNKIFDCDLPTFEYIPENLLDYLTFRDVETNKKVYSCNYDGGFMTTWGLQNYQDSQINVYKPQLIFLNIYNDPFRMCASSSFYVSNWTWDSILCAGKDDFVSCMGDSGSGLVKYKIGSDNVKRIFIVGIVSFAADEFCNISRANTIFTRIGGKNEKWIKKHLLNY